jgi:hypothetical protein
VSDQQPQRAEPWDGTAQQIRAWPFRRRQAAGAHLRRLSAGGAAGRAATGTRAAGAEGRAQRAARGRSLHSGRAAPLGRKAANGRATRCIGQGLVTRACVGGTPPSGGPGMPRGPRLPPLVLGPMAGKGCPLRRLIAARVGVLQGSGFFAIRSREASAPRKPGFCVQP